MFLSVFLITVVGAALHGGREPFELTGQIMLIADTAPRRIYVITQSNPDGYYFWDRTGAKTECQCGEIVKVQGYLDKPTSGILREISDSFVRYATNITVISNGKLPETVPATVQEIADSRSEKRFVNSEGTVISVVRDATNAAWNWLIVETSSGAVRAAATEHDYPYAELRSLLDAEVRIHGIAQEFHVWRKFMGGHIILYGRNGIEVTKAAKDPFSAPGLEAKTSHRKCVSGTVAGLSRRKVYIRDKNGAFISVSPSDPGKKPGAGERVTVSGFVRNGPMGIQLTEAVIRRDNGPAAPLEKAEDINAGRLLAASLGNDIVDASLYGKTVRIKGRIFNHTEDIVVSGRILLECDRKNISIDIAHLPHKIRASFATGSLLEVCGLGIPEFDADVTNIIFPEFKGLIVIPRVQEDIRILDSPPWWTPGRLAGVIVALIAALVAILIWNRMLKILSERRGRELCREQMSSAISELKAEERTRLAVELHDSISQVLTGIAYQIDAAISSGVDSGTRAGSFLATARSMLASCRHELRCCIWDLHARTFETDNLPEAIRQTLTPHIGEIPFLIRFNVPRALLDESLTHDMLRIIRELAVNAVRHGRATKIKVFGEYRNSTVRFSVKDNGLGFDPISAPGPAGGHFGLSGIRERVERRGGKITVESRPGEGASITVTLAFGGDESNER